jgi:hypothetical protein
MLLSYYCDDRIGRSSDGNSSKKSALWDSGVYEFPPGAGPFRRVRIKLPSKATSGAGIKVGALAGSKKAGSLLLPASLPLAPSFRC